MQLDDLAIFLAVADASGITAAARALHVPKSTVSRSLARLEAALGTRLVRRTTRRISLTEAGEQLRVRATSPIASLRAAVAEVARGTVEPAGIVRVTAPMDLGATVLADIVAAFTRRYPRIDVDVYLSNAVHDLVAEGLDLALRILGRPLRSSSLVARRGPPVAMHLVASPQYLAAQGAPEDVAALAHHAWITVRGMEVRPLRLRAAGRVRCDDISFARAAAIAGLGIAVLPAFLVADDLTAGRLVRVIPRWSMPSGTLWVIHSGGARPAAHVAAFRDFVLDALKRGPLGE